MFTKRRHSPSGPHSRSLMPGYCPSRFAINSATVLPVAVTWLAPPTLFRSGVGILTVMLTISSLDTLNNRHLCWHRLLLVQNIGLERGDVRFNEEEVVDFVLDGLRGLEPVASDIGHRALVRPDAPG